MLQFAGYRLLVKRSVLVVLAAGALALRCPAQEPGDGQSRAGEVVSVRPIIELLPATLAGIKSTGDVKQVQPSELNQIVEDKAPIFEEYGTIGAASREYGDYRVEIFQTLTPTGALGLFTYNSPEPVDLSKVKDSGLATARVPGATILWRSNFFVRIVPA